MNNLWMALRAEGQYDEAVMVFQRSILFGELSSPLNPLLPWRRYNLALTLSLMGDHKMAWAVAEEANVPARRYLGPENPVVIAIQRLIAQEAIKKEQ
jgi:hypothetical protein